MEQNIAWWQVILASSVIATLVGGWIGHLSAARLFRLQKGQNIELLKAQVAERYISDERSERRKLNSHLFSKVNETYSAAVSREGEHLDSAMNSLTKYYQDNYLSFGFDDSDHSKTSKFIGDLCQTLFFTIPHLKQGLPGNTGKIIAKFDEDLDQHHKELVEIVIEKGGGKHLVAEAIHFSNLIVETVKQGKGDD